MTVTKADRELARKYAQWREAEAAMEDFAKHREDAERPYRDLVALVKIAQHWHAFNCPPEGVPYDDLDDLWLDINEFLEEVE